MNLRLADEVSAALEKGEPVVALETSIVAQGLPAPQNLEVARRCEKAVRAAGATPATVAVLDGQLRIGLGAGELESLTAAGTAKASSRDLGPLLAGGGTGATTVAGTMRAAALAGIRFLATGGIGGVHRGGSDDVSADLVELSRSPVAVFCAGPKIILDVSATIERLESLAVPVVGYGCTEMPAFYTAGSGHRLDHRAETPAGLAAILEAAWQTGSAGVVVAIPPPEELPRAWELTERAVAELGDLHGLEATPRLLARIAELSGGRSVEVNVKLAVRNAEVAAETAVAWAAASTRHPR